MHHISLHHDMFGTWGGADLNCFPSLLFWQVLEREKAWRLPHFKTTTDLCTCWTHWLQVSKCRRSYHKDEDSQTWSCYLLQPHRQLLSEWDHEGTVSRVELRAAKKTVLSPHKTQQPVDDNHPYIQQPRHSRCSMKKHAARSANCTHQLETSDWWYTHVHTEGAGIYVPTETNYCHHQTKHERNRSNYVRDSVIPLYRRGVIISQTHSVSWMGQPIPSLHPLAFVSHETQWEMLHTYSEYV